MCDTLTTAYFEDSVAQATGWLTEEVVKMLNKGIDVPEMLLTDILFLENLSTNRPRTSADRVSYPNMDFPIPSLEGVL